MAWNRKFFRSFLILSGGNLAAQLINLVTYIILPKYFFEPAAFGVFGLFLALYYIAFELINLKMDQSVMLPKSNEEAGGLLGLSWLLAVTLSLLLFLVLLAAQQFTTRIPGYFPLLLCLATLFGGWMQPAMVWLNRQSSYIRMGQVRLIQAIATFGGSVLGFYWFNGDPKGLLFGFVAGAACGTAAAMLPVLSSGMRLPTWQGVQKYQVFMQYGSLSALLSTFSKNLPAFAIRSYFGDAALGWYTLASKYLNAPIGIFSSSLGQVYYKEISQAGRKQVKALTYSIAGRIAVISVIPVLVFLFFGSDIFGGIFGEQWQPAGKLFQIMIGWYFIAYISGPISMLLDVRLHLKWELGYNVFLLLGRVAALLSVFLFDNLYVVIGLYSAVGLLFNGYLLYYLLKLSERDA